jgi:hypothetical protein
LITDTLLQFFGDSNWPDVLDYQRYGIIDAEITTDPASRVVTSRIVLWTMSGNTWSVIQTLHTPPDLWEAVRVVEANGRLLGDPKYYELPDLLAILNR